MALDIAQLLAFAVKNKASDLHLSAGVPPMIRPLARRAARACPLGTGRTGRVFRVAED